MLHAGLDLSRNRLDVCLLSDQGEIVAEFKSPADRGGRVASSSASTATASRCARSSSR
jgi:hypothetical protein